MQTLKLKAIIFSILLVALLFFSNDFGMVEIEKTAIITAIGIDFDNEFTVTAQIAVPEATDINTENQKAQITGKGSTVASAIKNLGSTTGWYPELHFCNMIVIGNSALSENTITYLDYFSKSLRIQDSALLILAENSAKEILESSTPLDSISSFALQKVLFKSTGFDEDTLTVNIKDFCAGYYSKSNSSFMPIVSIIDHSGNQSGEGGGGEENQSQNQTEGGENGKGDKVIDSKRTALFYKGKKTGELEQTETMTLNALKKNIKYTVFEVNGVYKEQESTPTNYLLTVLKSKGERKMTVNEKGIFLDISLTLICKISDETSSYSDNPDGKNMPLTPEIKKKAEETFYESIKCLVNTVKQTKCDFLGIKENLYRYHYDYYPSYKDNYLDLLNFSIKVNVEGEK